MQPVADLAALAAGGWCVALLALSLVVWQRQRFDGAGRLVAEASHELRGPLCAARLAIGMLERSFAEAPSVGARLAAIDLELRRAGLAIDDLGAALEAGRGGDRPERLDLGELLRASEPVWAALARAHGATLVVKTSADEPRAWVLADRLRLAQAIGNLVANACEHGGGAVTVRVRSLPGWVRVEVSDLGPGLPASLDPSGRRTGLRRGAGVPRGRRGHGLRVAARIAAEAGGCLCTAPSRCGATLVVELPAAAPEPQRVRRAA